MHMQNRSGGLVLWFMRSAQKLSKVCPKPSCIFGGGSNRSLWSQEATVDDMLAQCGLETCIPLQPRCRSTPLTPREADSSSPLRAMNQSSRSLRAWKAPVEVASIDYDPDDILIQDLIGKGTHGSVYRAQLQGNTVAVKFLMRYSSSKSGSDRIPDPLRMLREMKLLQQASHPNLVRVHGVHVAAEDWDWDSPRMIDSCSPKSSLGSTPVASDEWFDLRDGGEMRAWVIMEYCDQGNVSDSTLRGEFHTGGNHATPNYSMITGVALEVAFAMRHLHMLDLIHGNLRAAKVLLQSSDSSKQNFKVKLGGFDQCGRPRSTR